MYVYRLYSMQTKLNVYICRYDMFNVHDIETLMYTYMGRVCGANGINFHEISSHKQLYGYNLFQINCSRV